MWLVRRIPNRHLPAAGLGWAPEGQGRLDAVLVVELTVLYFPFRQTAPTDNDNGFFRFSAGSLNLQPEKAAEPLLRFARKCPME